MCAWVGYCGRVGIDSLVLAGYRYALPPLMQLRATFLAMEGLTALDLLHRWEDLTYRSKTGILRP